MWFPVTFPLPWTIFPKPKEIFWLLKIIFAPLCKIKSNLKGMVYVRHQIKQIKGSFGPSQTIKGKKSIKLKVTIHGKWWKKEQNPKCNLQCKFLFIHFELSRAICFCHSRVPSMNMYKLWRDILIQNQKPFVKISC